MEKAFTIRGDGAKGNQIEIEFQNRIFPGTVGKNRTWEVTLSGLKANAVNEDMIIREGPRELTVKNLLVGELWVFSGQSNMAFPLKNATGGKQAMKEIPQAPIRILRFDAPPTTISPFNEEHLEQLKNIGLYRFSWKEPTAKSLASFSAIAWWAGKEIQARKGIPIGIICNAVGGTGTEAWLPARTLQKDAYRAIAGDRWLSSERISPWARGRAKLNIGKHDTTLHPFKPSWCYENLMSSLRDIPIAGVVWYQGETNAEQNAPAWNQQLICDLISGWRRDLNQAELPFYLVQLPRIGGTDPMRQFWPEYRASQAAAAKKMPCTKLAVTTDLGYDSPDVHPPDKRPVADRIVEVIFEER